MMQPAVDQIAVKLSEIGRSFYSRGWTMGTSGNFSAVVNRDPLTLAMTPSGADKGSLSPEEILLVDKDAKMISHQLAKPSAECPLHIRIVTDFGAGAVLHTHSVWTTALSDIHFSDGGISIEGYEMLKGLSSIDTHQHAEWLPILENSQDMWSLAEKVSSTLKRSPNIHGFLLRRHGLYTWGRDLDEARRHVEILEFLLETIGRTRSLTQGGH